MRLRRVEEQRLRGIATPLWRGGYRWDADPEEECPIAELAHVKGSRGQGAQGQPSSSLHKSVVVRRSQAGT